MKKLVYVIGGVLFGFILATSASTFADGVKSLIGTKVSGEYTVIIDGKRLVDKGAIIDGKANVPVRGISDALGADVKVSGKTITITSEELKSEGTSASSTNEYADWSKADLENRRSTLLEKILAPTQRERDSLVKDLEVAKSEKADTLVSTIEKQLALYDADIEKYTADLKQVEAAIAAIK